MKFNSSRVVAVLIALCLMLSAAFSSVAALADELVQNPLAAPETAARAAAVHPQQPITATIPAAREMCMHQQLRVLCREKTAAAEETEVIRQTRVLYMLLVPRM